MILVKDTNNEVDTGYGWYKCKDISQNRVFEHAQHGMAIISACRNGIPVGKPVSKFTSEEMRQYKACVERTKQLKEKLKQKGLGFIPTLGGWPEGDDQVDVSEFSFIVPYNPRVLSESEFLKFIVSLVQEYDQDAATISGIQSFNNGKPGFINKNFEVVEPMITDPTPKRYGESEFDINKTPYYTKLLKGGKEAYVYKTEDSFRYFGQHSPHGQAGHCSANYYGELNSDKFFKGE